jgi:anti-anti-sigma factor
VLTFEVPEAVISRRGPVRPTDAETCTVVWLWGEQDLATLAALSDTLARAVTSDDADVVVDLSDVLFMDAATLGTIVAARNQLRSQSRNLTLRAPSSSADRVLRLCGLTDLTVEFSATSTTQTAGR